MTNAPRLILLLTIFLIPGAAGASTLENVKSAVGRLTAREPVRATWTSERAVKASGKLANQDSTRTVTAQVANDAGGLTITVPQELVEKVSNRATREDSQDAMDGIRSREIADAIDFRSALLELLQHATVSEEKRVAYRGRPARLLVLKLDVPQRTRKNEITLGSVKVAEDRLTLWVGDDNLPLAGERIRETSGGFMMFRGESTSRIRFTFARAGDRLLLARLESSYDSSAFGTKIDESSVQILTVQ